MIALPIEVNFDRRTDFPCLFDLFFDEMPKFKDGQLDNLRQAQRDSSGDSFLRVFGWRFSEYHRGSQSGQQMAKDKLPATPAIRVLRENKIDFEYCLYKYEDKGGTEVAAKELGADEYRVIKTLVMEDDRKVPFIVLMHGNRHVSTKELARAIGSKSVSPCEPSTAQKHTGYLVGGISPFGTKKRLPAYVEESILSLPQIYINGGKRGLLVKMTPADLQKILQPTPIQAARE